MHCKDTILRTQNNWPYSKLIPNSGLLLIVEVDNQNFKFNNSVFILKTKSKFVKTKI